VREAGEEWWARGQLALAHALSSDARAAELRMRVRSRLWDTSPLQWEGRRVEPHIVHLPQPDTRPSGLWAEAAVDGAVVQERGFELTRWLRGDTVAPGC